MQFGFGTKSLRRVSPRIWNLLPLEIKSAENLNPRKHRILWNPGRVVNLLKLASVVL